MWAISGAPSPRGGEAQITVGFMVGGTWGRFRHVRVLKDPMGQARRTVTKPTELSRMQKDAGGGDLKNISQ